MRKKTHFLIGLIFLNLIFLFVNYQNINKHLTSSSSSGVSNDQTETNININSFVYRNTNLNNGPKIFCIILTHEKNLNTKAKISYGIWGHKCDNHRFITSLSTKIFNDLDLDFNETSVEVNVNNSFTVLQPAGIINDTYNKLTQKVSSAFREIYNRYGDYDWYLKADDDSFIFVDNLREFLKDKNASQPVTYGYDLKPFVDNGYHSGGGGYVLSKEALSRVGSKLNENKTFCHSTGFEDIDVARCLRKLGVYPNKSVDDLGRERFHSISLIGSFYGKHPTWLFDYSANKIKKGFECCSDTTISFHYMQPRDQIQMDLILKQRLTDRNNDMSFKYIIKKYFNLSDEEVQKYTNNSKMLVKSDEALISE